MFKRKRNDVTPLVFRDRARAGNRTGCVNGSEQDVTPEVDRKKLRTGSQTGCDTGSIGRGLG